MTAADLREGGGSPPSPTIETGFGSLVARIVRWWALAGGLLTLALALMAAASAVSNLATGRPFAADYELVKHVTAIAVFMFLPYCQITGSNVTVDIFTEGMGKRGKHLMSAFSSLFAIAFSLLLLVQMSSGFRSYIRYSEVTPVLKLPLWTAFPPILASLALLLLASIVTLSQDWRAMRNIDSGGGRAP
ncbi:TRAP transporter small permease [Mesorhizobium marinum]|uniref:TRAP transporter small permease protein n=1 Tax=Mesorhizobium marinum TaxID=3228790 RepID=A0ABV3R4M1_9HYPH